MKIQNLLDTAIFETAVLFENSSEKSAKFGLKID